MKRKLLTTAALGIIILGGVITPMFSFVGSTFGAHVAYAEDTPPPTNATTVDNQRAATEAAQRLDCGTNFICGGVLLISFIMTFVPKALATISGIILDYSIWYTIQSAPYTEQDGADSFVVSGWKLVRDFSNLLFIFALFAIAFSLILNSTGSGSIAGLDPKRTIVRVILMALLVNFSFFLCRVTIDVTNIFARMFYEKISAPVDTSSYSNVNDSTSNGTNSLGSTQEFYTNFVGVRSVSLGILNKVNPQALVLQNGRVQSSQNVVQWFTGWKEYDWSVYILILIVSFITMIFDAFLIYIFVTSFIFLIARTIGLFFFMILSPIAFVSLTIPSLQKKAYFGFDDWVTQFTGLAFTAPIYLFFMYLAVVFLKAPLLDSKATGILAISAVILIKLATIGMILIFGKKITQDLSGKIGAAAANVAKAGAMVVGAVATGGAAGFASGGFTGALTGAASQVGQMGKRYVKESGIGDAAGKAVFGEEKYAQMQASKSWGAATSFKNFDPRNAWKNRQALINVGSIATGPGVLGDINQAYRVGKYGNRLADRKATEEAAAKAKEQKEKLDAILTKSVNKEIADLKKEREDGFINKEDYEKKLLELGKKKKKILDPAFEHKDKLAGANKALTQLEKDKEKRKIGDDLSKNQNKSVDVNAKLTESINKLADVTTKATEITTKRADADAKIGVHATDLSQAKNDNDALALKLADIDKELKGTPTAGFGANIAKLNERAAVVTEQATLAKKTEKITLDLGKLKEEHASLVEAEKQVTKEKASAENTKNALEQQKADLETEKTNLIDERNAIETNIEDARVDIAMKEEGLKLKSEEVSLEKERAVKTRTEKTDYGNKQATEKRVEEIDRRTQELRDRLRDITGGSAP